MYWIIIFSIITRSLCLSNLLDTNAADNHGLLLKASCKGCYNFPQLDYLDNSDSTYYFLIEINLKNTSLKQVEFLTFSCTPFRNIVINSKDFNICQNRCINNQFSSILLNPGQEFLMPFIIKTNKMPSRYCINIGWAFLTKENTKNVNNYFNVLKRAMTDFENVIWSNEIYLDKNWSNPIEIK